MRQATPIMLTDEQRFELERRVRSQTLDARSVRRARIVLLAADGIGNHDIARRLEISRGQVISWRNRFMAGGMAGIAGDLPGDDRHSRDCAHDDADETEGATHWSTRKLATKLGISDTSVLKVWRANGIKPHLVETFKVSRDPKSVESLRTSSACTCLHPSMRSCCAATRRARCRAGSHPARLAVEEGTGSNDDPRLQAPRHDHFVRGDEHAGWIGHFLLRATASP